MPRTHYRNGDEITLACGCNGCNPSMINGVLCHEQGCPDAWRDEHRECKWCGSMFYPKAKGDRCCSEHCWCLWSGQECYCEDCKAVADAVEEGFATE